MTMTTSAYYEDDQKRKVAQRFQRMAEQYSDVHKIGALPKEVYEKCLHVPPEGIIWKRWLSVPPLHSEDDWTYWTFPVLHGVQVLTADAARHLGTYRIDGEFIRFVDRNGETWLSPCKSVIEAARRANGFHETEDYEVGVEMMFHPTGIFNGEDARLKWANLSKMG